MEDDYIRCVYAYSAKDGTLHWTRAAAEARNAVVDDKKSTRRGRGE